MIKSQNRKTEALLLLAVQIVLLLGLALVFFGKKVTTEYPPQAVDINTATAKTLAGALVVSRETAMELVAARGRGWSSAYSLRHAKALKEADAGKRADAGKEADAGPVDTALLVVRTPVEAARLFWGGVLAFIAAFWLTHAVLRKSAPAADPFLLPWAALLSGIGLMLVYSVKDPTETRRPFRDRSGA